MHEPRRKQRTNSQPQNPITKAVAEAARAVRENAGHFHTACTLRECKRRIDTLANAMRKLAYRTASVVLKNGRADDLATEVTMRCLEAFLEDKVLEGSEPGYVLRAAYYAVMSELRRDWRLNHLPTAIADKDRPGSTITPDMDAWMATLSCEPEYRTVNPSAEIEALDAERARSAKDDEEFLRSVVREAPGPMRELLEAHLAGVTTQQVVELQMSRVTIACPHKRAAFQRKLRARLDQRFARAKRYVRDRFAKRRSLA